MRAEEDWARMEGIVKRRGTKVNVKCMVRKVDPSRAICSRLNRLEVVFYTTLRT